MNINHITSTKNLTITGQGIRKTYNELIKLQNETKQKYINFYTNLQDNPALCNKFLFLNSIFNIALRESSNFKQTEYLYNLLSVFISECIELAPEALTVFDNELWSHCILINTHTHDNQFIKAVKNTLSLPIRSILEKMTGTGVSQINNYNSLTQYLSGADPDLSLTEPYETFLATMKIDKDVVLKELEQVRSLLVSSLPSENMYYILKFYLDIGFNPYIDIGGLHVNQYARICNDLVTDFLHSKRFIDEEIILSILDIHKTHKVSKFVESPYTKGLPSEGQWNFADYSIYYSTDKLIKDNKFLTYKNEAFLKFVDSCKRGSKTSDMRWIARAGALISSGDISDVEAQCYFFKTLKYFYAVDVINSHFLKDLIISIGKTIVNNKVITLLYKILNEYDNNSLLALFRAQVGPMINQSIKLYLAGKKNLLIDKMRLKDLLAIPGREIWRLLNKQFLNRKMAEENLALDKVAEILRHIHISTDRKIIENVIEQIKQFNDDSEDNELPESNKLLWNFLYSHAFYFEPDKITSIFTPDDEPLIVFFFRNRMKYKFKALSFIESSFIFDGKSKVIFVSDGRQFKDLTLLSPDNIGFDFRGLTMIDLTDPEGKYPPLPINSQTIKTFPQWVINLYSHQLAPNKEIIPSWMLKVALPYIFSKYKEIIAAIKPQSKSDTLLNDLNRCIKNIDEESDDLIEGVSSILQDTTPSFSSRLKNNIKLLDDSLEVLRITYNKNIHQTVYKEFVNELFIANEYKEKSRINERNFGIEVHKTYQLYLMGIVLGMLSGVKGLGEESSSIHFLRFFAGYIMQDLSNLLRIELAEAINEKVADQLLKTDSCSNSIISPLLSHPFTKKVINKYADESFIS
jgi:hypothetical protein